MDKNQKQLIMLAIILIVLLLTSIRAVIRIKKSRAKLAKARAVQPITIVPTLAPTEGQSVSTVAKGTATQSRWGVDPFTGRSIGVGLGQAASFKLSGIMYNRNVLMIHFQ